MRIAADAGSINRELRRTVWNGRLMASAQTGDRLRLKAVLAQVHHAGNRTRNRVSQAIRDLYRTALARARGQAHALARLAADIMDRNLYERANDCRWWAASPAIQAALEAAPGQADGRGLNQVLDHINGLYTVYSRLIVFDADGQVRGASRWGQESGLSGHSVPAGWLQAVRGITDPQRYAVSAFEVPALDPAHAPTYTYLAAVRSDHGRGQFLGGVAIVFNAAAEFSAMLRDVMGERPGFAAFVNAAGQVLACTDEAVALGQTLAFAGDEAEVEHLGAHYACARIRAAGYREFKVSDGYDNGVQVIVGLRLGAAERRRHSLSEIELAGRSPGADHQAIEAAVFSVGPHRYALPGEAVMMAVPPDGLVRTPGDPGNAGLLEVQIGEQRRALSVICARQRFGVGYPARATDGVVLVLRSSLDPQRPALGLRVDDVLGVLELHRNDLHPPPSLANTSLPIQGLIDCQAHAAGEAAQPALVQLLDAQAFLKGR
jgi:chemotaxis signal transduction protein